MNNDQGLIHVAMEHLARQVLPRAEEIEKELAAGRRLSDAQVDHVARVLEDVRRLRPLLERHPEHREMAERLIALYVDFARRAWKNEMSKGNGE